MSLDSFNNPNIVNSIHTLFIVIYDSIIINVHYNCIKPSLVRLISCYMLLLVNVITTFHFFYDTRCSYLYYVFSFNIQCFCIYVLHYVIQCLSLSIRLEVYMEHTLSCCNAWIIIAKLPNLTCERHDCSGFHLAQIWRRFI